MEPTPDLIENATAGMNAAQLIATCWLAYTVVDMRKKVAAYAVLTRKLINRVSHLLGELGKAPLDLEEE